MIFVTVGTHEQGFNRLVKEIDRLKGENAFDDEVIIQRGYSSYEPKNCTFYDLLPYEEMIKYQKEARIIITHGGPASFLYPLSIGKKPIVVPRQKKYGEHVNDHQLDFSLEVAKRGTPIVVISDITELKNAIAEHNADVKIDSNTGNFNKRFIEEIKEMFKN